ncbi:MAG: GNAT family N-acetyltransferase [Hyphomicrobiales bacterium]|nr:GNAT family N-acetyltransferase [Rickettsiales bacterium]MCP5361539.1 GNAT family N-acetyltransferase [Hyphomicrobiales bacterium]
MIRTATPDDIPDIVTIENTCFDSDRLSLRALRYMVHNAQVRFLVYTLRGKVVGYIITQCHQRSRLARHYSLAVLPDFRKRGVAEQLLRATEKACAHKEGYRLELRADNRAAQKLYQRLGYEVTGMREAYYADGEDAVQMVKWR